MITRLSGKRILKPVLFTIIVFAGLWLRMDSLDWGLPFRLHPDEWKYVGGAIRCHEGDWNPKYFRNPPGFTYLNALWYPIWLPICPRIQPPDWVGADPYTLAPSGNVRVTGNNRPFDLVLGGRVLAALMGVLTIVGIYLIARELGDEWISWVAVALAAVSFANVRESHFAVNDTSMTALVTFALWLGIQAAGRRSRWRFYTAMAVGGAAVAFKYSAFPVLFALLVIWSVMVFRNRSDEATTDHGHILLKALWIDIALSIGLAACCFLIICPFPIIDSSTFFHEMSKLSNAAAEGWPGQEKVWSGLLLLNALSTSEGWLSVLFSMIGVFALIKRRLWEYLIFPVCYLLLICMNTLFFIRFSLPLLPWISLTAAVGIVFCVKYSKEKRYQLIAAITLCVLCLIQPLLSDLRMNALLKETDTRIECLRWLRTEENSQVIIASDQYGLPIPYRTKSKVWSSLIDPRVGQIDSVKRDELLNYKELNNPPVGIVLFSSFAAFPGLVDETYEERRETIIQFTGSDTPSKVFHAFTGDWTPAPADVEDTYIPVTDLWSRTRPGPTIEVFRVVEPSDGSKSNP